jgi:hypothetical protein
VGFVVDKVALGRLSPSTSVSPANSHSTHHSILIYHPGLAYQVDSVSPQALNKREEENKMFWEELIAYFP